MTEMADAAARMRYTDPMKRFSIAGPIVPGKHYHIPPLERVPLNQWCQLVRDEEYFVVHAPRQSGKTSALMAFRDHLNSGAVGEYRCLHVNLQGVRAEGDDVKLAISTIFEELADQETRTLGETLLAGIWRDIVEQSTPGAALRKTLEQWANVSPQPLVLLLDEIDGLAGDSLDAVLHQLRVGYEFRPDKFPQSVVLCGLRNLEEYRLPDGSSPFNISAAALRLGDFSPEEVAALLAQHTAETGQAYAPAAVAAIWEHTQGQPWLVNALAAEMCARRGTDSARRDAIGMREVLDAKEALILRRATHLNQLAKRLREARVRRIIGPLLAGGDDPDCDDDLQYVRDLGLIALDDPVRIANPIYTEVIPRALTAALQRAMHDINPKDYVDADGRLNTGKLLRGFQGHFRENAPNWTRQATCDESDVQLVLQTYLHRIVNSKGRIEREYALGSRRVDLMVFWPWPEGEMRVVIECKVRRGENLETMLTQGLEQTVQYMDVAAADEGHLVIFDKSKKRSWNEKIYHRKEEHEGVTIGVWGV